MFKKIWLVVLMMATSNHFAHAVNLSTPAATPQYSSVTLSGNVVSGAGDNAGSSYQKIVDTAAGDLDLRGNLGLVPGGVQVGSALFVRFDLENAVHLQQILR